MTLELLGAAGHTRDPEPPPPPERRSDLTLGAAPGAERLVLGDDPHGLLAIPFVHFGARPVALRRFGLWRRWPLKPQEQTKHKTQITGET